MNDFQDKIQSYNEEQAQKAKERKDELLDVTLAKGIQKQVSASGNELQKAVVNSVATLMDFLSKNEPKVTVKNQVEFPDSINTSDVSKVVVTVKELIRAVSKREADLVQVTKSLEKLGKAVSSIPIAPGKIEVKNQIDYSKQLAALEKAVNKIDNKPLITVPDVIVPQIDTKPLADVFSKAFNSKNKGFDMSNFRAQDIDEQEQGIQYIGFVNPEGVWIIIRSDGEKNALRYKLGMKGYSRAWSKLATYKYVTLDEAVNEIQA